MDFNNLSIYQPKMEYRRFGKTEKKLSVITLGGMRFKHGWTDPRHEIPDDTLEQVVDSIKKAFAQGINHIETAYGYKKSETAYGIALNDVLKVDRSSYYLMTKGDPKTADDTYRLIEEQLKTLKTDYFDFYAWHGMNTVDIVNKQCVKGGSVEALLKLKEQGVIKHVGFSTHGPLEAIIKAIETDLFDFVNLHYYYTFQRNKAAIDLAETKDMGVFIISPNDKGGKLGTPPQKLKDLTAPLSPSQWNARFCLGNSAIHTLTFGLPVTSSFEDLNGIFPTSVPMNPQDELIKHHLDAEKLKIPFATYEGHGMYNDPSGINIPEILRFRTLLKCFDMKEFGEYRYNMFVEGDTWFPGAFPLNGKIEQIDMSRCPEGIPLKEMIKETHEALYKPKKK
ncbi:MAG: aldo/keto reductase [Salinivirgaceae bacterium]|jgi:predicted aldo/keto reductase-like oxidoreductase|nr:aldo/keto reductase [Salinivirgaceae bacterium]